MCVCVFVCRFVCVFVCLFVCLCERRKQRQQNPKKKPPQWKVTCSFACRVCRGSPKIESSRQEVQKKKARDKTKWREERLLDFFNKKSLAFLLACQAKQNGCVLVVQKESKRLLHIFTTATHKQQQQQQSRGRNGKEREKLQLTAPLPFSNTSTTPPGMEPQHEDVPPPTYRSFTR